MARMFLRRLGLMFVLMATAFPESSFYNSFFFSFLGGCEALSIPFPPLMTTAEHLPLAEKAMEYFDRSSDPFHAVQTSIDLLRTVGFEELNEDVVTVGDSVASGRPIRPGGKYYYTRNRSTLVAFAVGEAYRPGQGGFKVVGGHTDSPNLKVKPRSKRTADPKPGKSVQVGVECYGGGLWYTWFDRDLGISGRVFCRRNQDGAGRIEQRLIKVDRPILRIPNLAIHLQSEEERKAFKVNKEDHLSPILAMAAQKALNGDASAGSPCDTTAVSDDEGENNPQGSEGDKEKTTTTTTKQDDGWTEYQEPLLLQLLAAELDIPAEDIVDFELNLFDVQKASLGGVHSEFIHSARLDNLASCFLAVQALVECIQRDGYLRDDRDISMVVLYDHEEVGSSSAVGAAGPIMGEAVKKISATLNTNNDGTTTIAPYDLYEATIRKSFVLSSDQSHALHPNYASKHEKNHQPQMNAGMVIKRNSNQRYATNGVTGVIIREIARRASLPPVQEFMVRQDCGCGSTIGPLISTATGIRAIDMGCPQLSMHSIRETMGVCDLTNGLELFKAFFVHFREVDESLDQ